MPTARELLEQADALMRKNRMGPGGAGASRPPSIGARPSSPGSATNLPVSPRPIQLEPIAPSVARTSLPVDPTESPEIVPLAPPAAPRAEPSQPSPSELAPAGPTEPLPVRTDEIASPPSAGTAHGRTPAPEPDGGLVSVPEVPPEPATSFAAQEVDDGALAMSASSVDAGGRADEEFPLLTDTVDESITKVVAARPLDEWVDDVPVLTDAVEEIDVGIVEEARGEPSLWELTSRGETSVLGPAPDSIIVVPAPELRLPVVPQVPPEHGRDPLGLDLPPVGYLPPELPHAAAADPEERAEAVAPLPAIDTGRDAGWSATAGVFDPSREADSFPSTASAGDLASAAETKDGEEGAFDASLEPEVPPVTEGEPPVPDASGAFGGSMPLTRDALWHADDARDTLPAAQVAQPSAEAAASALQSVSEGDQQRIREIAEEIGMQVLQRIDIFTDTTLRTQLGERLRPVVDRAAADLVAAINEHVGELLRVYISEAIEREIESWRNTKR